MQRLRVPRLSSSGTVVRLAKDVDEIGSANRLVFESYVELGYWKNDKRELEQNRYLHLAGRHVLVVVENDKVIGTVSIIPDSPAGLPADTFQPVIMKHLRCINETLAEISAFAIAKDHPHQRSLVHFLMAYVLQYSFYYAEIDRFVAVCTPKHARFYESNYGFQRLEATSLYNYVSVEAQMLTLDLADSYERFKVFYPAVDPANSFFRFLYIDEHPNLVLPPRGQMRRSRQLAWSAYATEYPVAV